MEIIRPQDGADKIFVAPDDAVLVEIGNFGKGRLDLAAQRLGLRLIAAAGIKQREEEPHDELGDAGMLHQRLRHVVVRVRRGRLADVAPEGAEQRHFAARSWPRSAPAN